MAEGQWLWSPHDAFVADAPVEHFRRWLNARRGMDLPDYDALWAWSVADLEGFWAAIWDYFEVRSETPYRCVLDRRVMPGALWFEGARVNYAEHLLRHATLAPDAPALMFASERGVLGRLSWRELDRQVRQLATQLRALGIGPGDHVAAFMPNIPQTAIAMMATVAVGAIWSTASPEFGASAVIDRLRQVRPKLLFAVDGYRFAGQDYSRVEEVRRICAQLDSIEQLVWLPYLDADAIPPPVHAQVRLWTTLLRSPDGPVEDFRFERVAHDHPLWVLFSSGTTGPPKAIVHSHVGVLVEHLKLTAFHVGLRQGSRVLYHSTTGWMMWNVLIASLLQGATAVLYDGSPIEPDPLVLWRIADQAGVDVLGVSPAYVQIQQRGGVRPCKQFALERLNTVLLAGAPSMPETFAWFYQAVKADLWVTSQSGGTEVASALAAATPTHPVYAGEIQTRALGVDAEVWDDQGRAQIDRVGELVIRSPMPSMPLRFADDADGRRYRDAYFTGYPQHPGVWRHGDYMKLNARGGCYIYGRSDAMLNRYGVCIGTSEIYRSVERVPEVLDSLVVCCEMAGGRVFIPMFVKLRAGCSLDVTLRERIAAQLRSDCSPRHVPDQIYAVDEIPYTLTGKKMEVPVRRLLMGATPAQAMSRDSTMNPAAIDWFVRFRERHLAMLSG
ncbi:acetoacetate--CoA ligase [Sinimarinibacterium sp. CAU 1509]|nr:acetoacetate--CoA ligase [Sinimarinibacterium sp. CAU 1509]